MATPPAPLRPWLTRRGVLIGAAAGGGLLAAWGLVAGFPGRGSERAFSETAFNAWLRIGRDGVVTVAVPQLEMGQGITTLLPQIVAQELGADWRRIAVEPAPVGGAFANVPLAASWAPLWMPTLASLAKDDGDGEGSWLARDWARRSRFTATADGTALDAYEAPAREAACAVRTMLMQAAADRWGVDWEACTVAAGEVRHETRRAGFGDLAEDAAGFDPPSSLPLRPLASESTAAYAPGAAIPFPRLDLPAKATGQANFAADVRLPGMVFAAIRQAPRGAEAQLARYDPALANLPGIRLVRGKDWLAATGSTWWAAEQALVRVAPRFRVSRPAESQAIDALLDKAVRKARTHRIETVGDPDAAIGDKPTLVARYDVAPALHAGIETASAAARFTDGKLEIWIATQAPEATRKAAARGAGISAESVVLYPVAAGGSFDARLETPHAEQVAAIAREIGKPVQLTWSRWQEAVAAFPRAPAAAVLWARTDADSGAVLGWKTRIATPAAAQEFGYRLFGEGSPADAMDAAKGLADPMALAGAVPPYALSAFALDHVPVTTGIPAGRMRGNGHAMTAFFTESFVDELARAAGREPLSYRIAMLGHDVRLAECLQRCAALAQWDAGADASGQGLACHRMGTIARGGAIAVIVTARREESGVKVDRISAVADIGRIVNLDIARQQIEGGLVFGLGLALGASIGWAGGLPLSGQIDALGLPTLATTPEIAVEFVESTAPAFDPGELGVAAVAPALANALHSATGIRFRKLPLFGEDV